MTTTPPRLLRLLIVLAVVAGFFQAVSTGTAHADSGYGYCWQSTCNGKDPVNQDCTANTVNVKTYTEGSDEIDLRYSPDCDSNWVRVLTTTAEPFFVENSKGNIARYTSVPGAFSWSNMVDGSVHAWGCLQIPITDMQGYTAIWASDNLTGGEAQYPNCPKTA